MKARRKVSIEKGGKAPKAKRTPTVRKLGSAIVSPPSPQKAATPRGTSQPTAVEPPGAGGSAVTVSTDLSVDLSVDLAPARPGGLRLANPILVASGTFGYGVEYGDVVDIERLGAICCKGTTRKPRVGNIPPRVTETPGGMLNSIGLQNPGVDAVIEKYAATWAGWRVPVIVNVAGESVADYVEVVRRLDSVPGIAGIELNISCPNVGAGGLQFAIDADAAAGVTAAVRRATDLPLLVKLSPNVADVRPIARAIAEAGADALTAVNTLSGIAVAPGRGRPLLGNVYGGLSGPAIKPVALRMVYQVSSAIDVPIVGCGGIMTGADAVEFLMAGATAVQVGTATFVNPRAPLDVLEGLQRFMEEHNVSDVRELIGAASAPGGRT